MKIDFTLASFEKYDLYFINYALLCFYLCFQNKEIWADFSDKYSEEIESRGDDISMQFFYISQLIKKENLDISLTIVSDRVYRVELSENTYTLLQIKYSEFTSTSPRLASKISTADIIV